MTRVVSSSLCVRQQFAKQLDHVHTQASLGTEQSYQCESWPAGEREVGGNRAREQQETNMPNLKPQIRSEPNT